MGYLLCAADRLPAQVWGCACRRPPVPAHPRFTKAPLSDNLLGCLAGIDVHFLTLPAHFKNPFVRDWILLHGMLDTSRATCKRILSGWASQKYPGRPAHMLLCPHGCQQQGDAQQQ